jgi:crossover junction endodeoxyribonuclease RuvC
MGHISTDAGTPFPDRLLDIHNTLDALIREHNPDAVAIEQLYFSKNVKTGIAVAHGRGTILLTAARLGQKIAEYTPLQIKIAVTGYGQADKKQVQSMVKTLLNLRTVPKPDDVADALATAICHCHSSRRGLRQPGL